MQNPNERPQICGRVHDAAEACGGCAAARREARERGDFRAPERAEAYGALSAIRACRYCDGDGWRIYDTPDPDDERHAVRCNHQPPTEAHLAASREGGGRPAWARSLDAMPDLPSPRVKHEAREVAAIARYREAFPDGDWDHEPECVKVAYRGAANARKRDAEAARLGLPKPYPFDSPRKED